MPQEKAKSHNLKAVPKLVNIPKTLDAFPDIILCEICFGSGFEVVPDKGARICICRKRENKDDIWTRVRLPKRYDGFHFENYKPLNPSQIAAREYAYNLTNEYPAVVKGILFMGSVGLGKTHLAVSILKGLTERGFSCLFYDFASLLKEIQDSYSDRMKTSELSVLAPVLNTELLVLDELGSSKPTDWVRDTMAHIINKRYNDKKLTIFTTNYLDERTDLREEILEDRIGVRLRSRLYEMCHGIVLSGDDYRKTFVKAARVQK